MPLRSSAALQRRARARATTASHNATTPSAPIAGPRSINDLRWSIRAPPTSRGVSPIIFSYADRMLVAASAARESTAGKAGPPFAQHWQHGGRARVPAPIQRHPCLKHFSIVRLGRFA
jgi:hypothetical protein